jgi:hypothetical protein
MPKLRVHNFSVSVDGYAAGPDQNLDNPLVSDACNPATGLSYPAFRQMFGEEGGDQGIDDHFPAAGEESLGATIMAATCSGPYAAARPTTNRRAGGATSRRIAIRNSFLRTIPVSRSPWRADCFPLCNRRVEHAYQAADGQDVRLAGGVSAIQQYPRAWLVDEMHLAYVPLLLGSGERLFDNLEDVPSGYEVAEFVGTPTALHVRVVRSA